MDIATLYNFFEKYRIISTDTRKIEKNSIFFALKGANFNGNKFAQDALEKGAALAIVDEAEFADGNNIVLVDNCLQTLQQLANYHRKQLKYPIIGITGTNGKTTTKELINASLSAKYKVKATSGNLNNHIGVPLTLLAFPDDLDFGIVEMGANHKGEIAELCEISEPDYGIITNIGKAHIEGFGSFEAVIKTKNELYDSVKRKNGTIFYNSDNEILRKLISDYKNTIAFDTSGKEFYNGILSEITPFVKFVFSKGEENISIHTKLIGDYNLENLTAAATIASYFDVELAGVKKALEKYTPDNKRSQLLETEKNKLIVDAYNANATSMNKALDNFFALQESKKALILGDMLELGKESGKEHLNILNKIKEHNCKNVFLVGKEFFKFRDDFNFNFFENVESLHSFFEKNVVLDKHLILLKGSRGIRLEKIIDIL